MLPSRFLIGVDSDGTAFDSMNIKHLEAFIPAALEIWPMEDEAARKFTEIEKEVNLFSSLRGINRFPGLLEAFNRLKLAAPDAASLPDTQDLALYIAQENRYSPATLSAYLKAHPSRELQKVLDWSDRVDVLFERACEGLGPFPGVAEALAEAHKEAAVAVVSSAAKAGLQKDWAAGGLLPSVDLLMSQEDGSKTAQLRKAMSLCEPNVCALMLGDTDSDGISAHEAGARFYPILPGKEEESWRHFHAEILPLFLSGSYDDALEKVYYDQLKEMLA